MDPAKENLSYFINKVDIEKVAYLLSSENKDGQINTKYFSSLIDGMSRDKMDVFMDKIPQRTLKHLINGVRDLGHIIASSNDWSFEGLIILILGTKMNITNLVIHLNQTNVEELFKDMTSMDSLILSINTATIISN